MKLTLFAIATITSILIMHMAHAQGNPPKIKVLKVSERKAVVKFSQESEPIEGEIYVVVPEDEYETYSYEMREQRKSVVSSFVGGRGKSIALTFSYSSLSTEVEGSSSSTDISAMELNAEFGWNGGTWEFGPIIGYESTSSNAGSSETSSSSLLLGLFFDYNFQHNQPGEELIFGLRGKGYYQSGSIDTGSITTDSSGTGLYGGVFVKSYALTSSTALRLDFGYKQETQTVDGSNSDTTVSGIVFAVGIATYY